MYVAGLYSELLAQARREKAGILDVITCYGAFQWGFWGPELYPAQFLAENPNLGNFLLYPLDK